ncbi:MAG: orotidine-5'-phosphate decarboxylase [Balneolaceae bacterium]
MNYTDKLGKAVKEVESVLCVGLDPSPELIPGELHKLYSEPVDLVEAFCKEAIDATSDYCCAYKPNLAFFEALGGEGLLLFERLLKLIPPEKILIADAKRGDIGSTAGQYKKAYFDHFDTDAITLNPLMGFETLDPFLQDESKAVYSLVLTSNPGAEDLLNREFRDHQTLAEYIADQLKQKSETSKTHIGMVLGATKPSALKSIMELHPTASLLIPGIGSQGGRPEDLRPVLSGHQGIPIITSSRSILYGTPRPDRKSSGPEAKSDWKSAIAGRAKKMKEEIRQITQRYV